MSSNNTDSASALPSPPPGTWNPAYRLARVVSNPFESFFKIEASSGVLLLLCAVGALVWANSPWQDSYHHLWHTPFGVTLGSFEFRHELHFWINDGLMVIFFFVVGLEIRREIHAGELRDFRRASLPVIAALGGMVAPAACYLALNSSGPGVSGWGIPMATDIAFAVGVLTLMGSRVPPALRVLLLALAIIDDIGAILVIAIFYSDGVSGAGLALSGLGMLSVLLLQSAGVRSVLLYLPPSLIIWAGMFRAGIHPTIAGVIIGLMTPVKSWFGLQGFMLRAGDVVATFGDKGRTPLHEHDMIAPLRQLNQASREAVAPAAWLEARLHPWVAFGIMPIFALANAGVSLGAVEWEIAGGTAVAAGVIFGLLLGKPLGIVGFSYVAVRSGLCSMPSGVTPRALWVLGCLGGIGFTMALFVAQLAFGSSGYLGIAKLGVLIGTFAAGIAGLCLGLMILARPSKVHCKV